MSQSRHFFVTKGARQAANVVDTWATGLERVLPLTKFHNGWCPPPSPTAHAHRPRKRRCYQRALSQMPF